MKHRQHWLFVLCCLLMVAATVAVFGWLIPALIGMA